MAGSTAFLPFAEKLAEQYMTTHPEVSITVQGGGSAQGVQTTLSGTAQIGMADLVELPPDAKSLKSVVVARDGVAVVVNPANKIEGLTMEQIRSIFSGKIRNWKDVGGVDHPIAVVSREAGSGTRSSFEQIIGEKNLAGDALIQNANGTVRETVAKDANSIGYVSHGLVSERIKAVKVDGAPCTEEAIEAGSYKLVRPIFLLAKADASPACNAFLEYVLSAEGQGLIHSNGLIRAK
jgi:phosphate transport system substrate-binding protein